MPYRVTFGCTGNICRSPMAEHIFRHHVEEEGLDVEVDSSGTGYWPVGAPADARTVATLRRAGFRSSHRARQFEAAWFVLFVFFFVFVFVFWLFLFCFLFVLVVR